MKTGNKLQEPTNQEKLKVILEHIDLAVKEKGENIAVKEMRKHLSWYIKNIPDASRIRGIINKIDNRAELISCLKEYFN